MRFSNSSEMSLIGHLEALRNALIRIGWCLAVLFVPTTYFAGNLIDLLIRYTCPPGLELKYFSPMEPLWVQLKVALLASLAIGMPYMAWQVWRFVAPGLYERERQFVFRLAVSSWLMFLFGSFCAIEFIMPMMMKFSLTLQTDYVQPVIGLESFVSMTGLLVLGFGLMFQLPIAVYLLIRSGLMEISFIRRQRPYIIVLILILAAILTPPDVISQIMLAVPSYLMFEISLLLASFTCRKKNAPTESEKEEESLPTESALRAEEHPAADSAAPDAPLSADPPEDATDFRPEQVYRTSFRNARRRLVNSGRNHRRRL